MGNKELNDAFRRYVRAHVLWHGLGQTTRSLGVSRQTLWRFLEREHTGRAVPQAVLDAVGCSAEVIEAPTERLVARARTSEAASQWLIDNALATERNRALGLAPCPRA